VALSAFAKVARQTASVARDSPARYGIASVGSDPEPWRLKLAISAAQNDELAHLFIWAAQPLTFLDRRRRSHASSERTTSSTVRPRTWRRRSTASAVRGRLVVVGVDAEPTQVSPLQLIGASRSVVGRAAGASIDSQDTLAFGTLSGVRPMIETLPLARAAARMMRGDARFRMVLTVA
jgi:hypothetical protein